MTSTIFNDKEWRVEATDLLWQVSGFLDAMMHTVGIKNTEPIRSLKQKVDRLAEVSEESIRR